MRYNDLSFLYWFSRYYRSNLVRRLIASVCLVVILLGIFLFFLDKDRMIFIDDKARAILLKGMSRGFNRYIPNDPVLPEMSTSPMVPTACLSSKVNGCVCYDKHQNRIIDFPEEHCQNIVNGVSKYLQ